MSIIVKEVPRTFDHHILLYAKNWYKRSENIVADLRVLLCEYSALYPEHVSDNDIRRLLCGCWNEYAPWFNKDEQLQEMLGWSWYNNFRQRTPEEIMIGSLSIAEGKYVDPTELLPVLVKEKEIA